MPDELPEGFDPSSAVPTGDFAQPSLLSKIAPGLNTKTPVDQPPLDTAGAPTEFDPSSAVPEKDHLAAEARSLLSQHIAGKIDLPRVQLDHLTQLAEEGKGAWRRAVDWMVPIAQTVTNPISLAKSVVGAGKYAATLGYSIGQEVGGDVYQAAMEAPDEWSKGVVPGLKSMAAPEANFLKRSTFGVVKGLAKAIPVVAGVAGEANDLIAQPMGIDTSSQVSGLYQFEHDMNQATDAIGEKIGVKPDSPTSEGGELASMAMLPGGAERVAAGVVAKGADLAVEAAPKIAGGLLKGAAVTADKAAPAIAAAELASHGHPLMALASMLAGYGGQKFGWLASIKHMLLDKGIDGAKALADALMDAPQGTTVLEHAQNGMYQEAANIQAKLANEMKAATPEDISKLGMVNPDGTPMYSAGDKALSSQARLIRDLQSQAASAAKTADNMGPYVKANQILSDSAKYALRTSGNLGVAGATGAAFASAGAAPEDREAEQQGLNMGIGLGLFGVRGANRDGVLAMNKSRLLKDYAMPEDHILAEEHQANMNDLPKGTQDYINTFSALSVKNGGKHIVVLSPDEMVSALKEHEGEDVAQAPNGFNGNKAVYVNSEALASGVVPHEVTHATGIDSNPKVLEAIQAMQADPEQKAKLDIAIDNYNQALDVNLPGQKLSTNATPKEIAAALGADMLTTLPPEAIYGGKSGGKIVSQWLKNKFGSSDTPSVTQQYGFPVTPEMKSAMEDALYDAGKVAEQGAKPKPVANPEPEPETAPANADIRKQAIAAMRALGVKDPIPKVNAAMADVGPDATLEDVVKHATQRAVPKSDIVNPKEPRQEPKKPGLGDIEDQVDKPGSMMPSSSDDKLESPAIQLSDGMIIRGYTHDHAIKEADSMGLDTKGAVTGFTTKKGSFLAQDSRVGKQDALNWGLETGQLPEGTTQLTDHDLHGNQLMPTSPNKLKVQKDGTAKAWIDDKGNIIPLTGGHPEAFQKATGKEMDDSAESKLAGIQAGWSRINLRKDGRAMIEVPEAKWGKVKESVKQLLLDNISGVHTTDISLLNNKGITVGGADIVNRMKPEPIESAPIFQEKQGKASDALLRRRGDLSALMFNSPDAQLMPSSDKSIDKVIRDYTSRAGLDYVPHSEYRPIDEEYSKAIADQYGQQKHDPKNPEVRKAYDAFRDGIMGQYQTLLDHGYKIEPWPKEGQPYANSGEMLKDLRENKHLYYFKTDKGYGNKGGSTAMEHPMLRGSGIYFDGEEAPINDIFRPVHDALGHGAMGFQFGPRGEYNAFLAHASTLPPESHKALATETLGQNSWTNFGPHMRDEKGNLIKPGEPGYLPITDRPYTEQRANLLDFMPSGPILPHEVSGTNSRPVTADEFSQLSEQGRKHLSSLKSSSSPTSGLTKHWEDIKDRAWQEAQKSWGGMAVDAHTGQYKIGPIGLGGDVGDGPFGVTAKESGQRTIEIPDNSTRAEFDRAMEKARGSFPQLANKDYHLSVFHDDNKGTIDIDPTVIIADKATAEAVGAHTRALGGIYDFDSGNGLYPPHVSEGQNNAPEAPPARPEPVEGSGQPEAGPSVDSPPWVHEYFALDKKDLAGTITPEEAKRMDELHQRAEKEYGSYDNFYKAHGGKQYNADNLFQFMPSDDPRAIKEAAVMILKSGKVYTGLYHADIIRKLPQDYGYQMGWMTNDGEFLDRREAASRAKSVGQDVRNDTGVLHSGDISDEQMSDNGPGIEGAKADFRYMPTSPEDAISRVPIYPHSDDYAHTVYGTKIPSTELSTGLTPNDRQLESALGISPTPDTMHIDRPEGYDQAAFAKMENPRFVIGHDYGKEGMYWPINDEISAAKGEGRDGVVALHPKSLPPEIRKHAWSPFDEPDQHRLDLMDKFVRENPDKVDWEHEQNQVVPFNKPESSPGVNPDTILDRYNKGEITKEQMQSDLEGQPMFMPATDHAVDLSDQRIPTRTPWGAKPTTTAGEQDVKNILSDPKYTNKVANFLRENLPQELHTSDDAQQVENGIEFFKRNLLRHNDLAKEYPWYGRAIKQYAGYNIRAHDIARESGVSPDRVMAMESALSPNQSPDTSFEQARRVIDVLKNQQDHAWDDKMSKAAQEFNTPLQQQVASSLKGKTLSELTDPVDQAMFIRAYDEAYNNKDYRMVTPEGDLGDLKRNMDGTPSKLAWTSFAQMARGIDIYNGANPADILTTPKVSNYHNSKLAAESPSRDVVSDTHHTSAAFFNSLPSNSRITGVNFGGLKHAATGEYGLYSMIHEATNRAAGEEGMNPKEMQAGIWSHQRGFMSPNALSKTTVDKIQQLWQDANQGKINEQEAVTEALRLAKEDKGEATTPEWALPRPDSQQAGENGGARQPGELSRTVRAPAQSSGRTGGRASSRGLAGLGEPL